MERFHGLGGTSVGAYTLWDCLGHGSCTAVYRAFAGDAECAVKLVDVRLNESGELAARLGRERAVLATIGHDGILPIQEAIRGHAMTAVAMPLKRAASLRDLLRQGPLDTELAWTILNQIAESLDLVHQRGLVYRVLKPANILVDHDGRAYLAEFGVTGQRTGQLALATPEFQLAAPQYLAPEQIEGRELDHRADIYAFAVLAFELATGTPLHGTASPADVLRATLEHPSPSARGRNPRLPEEADAVFARALARDPEQRHPRVWDLMEQLVDPPAGQAARPAPAGAARAADGSLPALPDLDVATVDGLVEDVRDSFLADCVRFGRQVAGQRWRSVVRVAGLQQYLVDDPVEQGRQVPDLLTLSRLVDAFDVVHGEDAPGYLGRWGHLVGQRLLRSIQEKPPWIAGPPTGRLVDVLSVLVATLDRIRGEELHAWKQVNRTLFRVVHMQNMTAVGRRRQTEACHFWKGAYEAALEWGGLAGEWLVAEVECGCVTGTYDCVFSLIRAGG
jgi:serine/threonine-protein kinase